MEAAGEIAIVREAFESVVTSAEASLRIMRPRLKPIHPSATDKVRTLLKQHTDNLPQSLMESAILLIATTLEAINTIPLPEVELGNEALEVIWGDSAELQWIIRTPPFSWPGVHVKALSSNSPQNVRSFVLAHHVIDHAKSILR